MIKHHSIFGLHWEEDPDVAAILGWTCTVITILFCLSHVRVMKTIISSKSTLDYRGEVYVTGFFNFSLWSVYCFKSHIVQALVCNITGMIIESVYLVIYIYYASERMYTIKQILLGITIVLVISITTALINIPDVYDGQSLFTFSFGLTADVFNILLYGAPLSIMAIVIRTKSVEFMPLAVSVSTLLCTACWTMYGFYILDIWFLIPNGSGVILSICQLILYAMYYKSDVTKILEAEVYESSIENEEFQYMTLNSDGN